MRSTTSSFCSGGKYGDEHQPRTQAISPSTFTRLTADCEWLTEHVMRAGYDGNACKFLNIVGEPCEPPIPAAQPEGANPCGKAVDEPGIR